MKFHAFHFKWLWNYEAIILFGFATGRIEYDPEARWLYSFRLFLGVLKVEILWTTGTRTRTDAEIEVELSRFEENE